MLRPLLLSVAFLLAPHAHSSARTLSVRASTPASADTVGYAGDRRWYAAGEAITFGGRRWVKYGLTRSLTITGATKVGAFDGVGVYRHADDGARADVLYLPVRAGCEFQPYRPERDVAGVRG